MSKILWTRFLESATKEVVSEKITGLVAATFAPMGNDGALDLSKVPAIVDFLAKNRISGLYVNGSTGEGPSLTTAERLATAEAYVAAAGDRIKTIIQVGHNSLHEARDMARHAAALGVHAISATPPSYFKPDSVDLLIDCLAEITDGAESVPFYYYHIPPLTDVALPMVEFLEKSKTRLPNLRGIKFSSTALHELRACLDAADGAYDILFGVDEMLLAALAMGVKGAVGSTYNFAAPVYQNVIEAFNSGDLAKAQEWQSKSVQMVGAINACGGRLALKPTMGLRGFDCGPHRLPTRDPSAADLAQLKQSLEAIGFFDWV